MLERGVFMTMLEDSEEMARRVRTAAVRMTFRRATLSVAAALRSHDPNALDALLRHGIQRFLPSGSETGA